MAAALRAQRPRAVAGLLILQRLSWGPHGPAQPRRWHPALRAVGKASGRSDPFLLPPLAGRPHRCPPGLAPRPPDGRAGPPAFPAAAYPALAAQQLGRRGLWGALRAKPLAPSANPRVWPSPEQCKPEGIEYPPRPPGFLQDAPRGTGTPSQRPETNSWLTGIRRNVFVTSYRIVSVLDFKLFVKL